MFFTGFTRFSSEVSKMANAASSPTDKKLMLNQMYDLVDEAEAILVNKDRT